MTRKFSAARRTAFLRAVAESGNQTLAAERARVSRSWVAMTRAAEPEFDAAVRAAVAAYKESRALASIKINGSGIAPPSGWGSQAGVDLVVRGTNGRRVQVARARLRGWSPRVEARFLATLAATCNVKAACADVGLSPASAYYHRHRHQGFRTAWDQAIEIGYDKIEAALIETACVSLEGAPFAADAPLPPMSVADAIHLLHMHKHAIRGTGKRPGRVRKRRTLDDPAIRAGIVRKLEMVERMRDRKDK